MKKGADWNPLSELQSVQKRMNQLFESALARSDFEDQEGIGLWAPVCDAYEAGDELVIVSGKAGRQHLETHGHTDGRGEPFAQRARGHLHAGSLACPADDRGG